MRAASVAGLVLASLSKLANAEDLLFYNDMLYNEYKEATTTLGFTAKIASDAEWRSYTTADFAKYQAIIIPDPNCGTIDKIKFLEDTKAVWSPAVTGNMILIGTDPTYHSASRSGAIDLIDDSIRFAASNSTGTGLYFSLSCYYDSGDTTTINALTEFGTFYVRGRLACYNDAHLVADAPELKSLDDSSIGNWSCSVHEVFTEFPKIGVEPGTDGFEAFAIARNATGDGEESYADGSSGIPYIIARGAIPVGCGDGKLEASFGEECDNGKGANGTPGNPCSISCKCLYGVLSPGVCKLSNTTSSSSSTMSSSSTVISNSSTALPSTSANSTLPSSAPPETTTSSAPSISESSSVTPASSAPPGLITVTAGPSGSAPVVVPSNSTDLAGPLPPVTVTASAGSPDPSSPPRPPPPGPVPPITIVTTIDGPTPSVITIIATADPPLSAESGTGPPGPLPPITIVTTIDGPVPSVITVIAEPPPAMTHPMPPPGVPGAPSSADPSYTTMGAPGAGPSSAPGNPGSTTGLTIGAPGASGPIIPPLPSIGPSGPGLPASGSPSFVTVVTSAGANPGNAPPATSAPGNGPNNPSSAPAPPNNPGPSTETSVLTALSTVAPSGGSPTNSGSGSLSSAPGAPTSVATSVQTAINTIGAPSSALPNPNGPGNSVPAGASTTGGLPTFSSPSNSASSGSADAGIPSAPGTSTSIDVSFLSALNSGSPTFAPSSLAGTSGPADSNSAAPTNSVSGSGIAPGSGAPTYTASSGNGAPNSGIPGSGGSGSSGGSGGSGGSLTDTAPGLPASSGPAGASSPGSPKPTSVGAPFPSVNGTLSGVGSPTSLPGNPHPPVSDSSVISASPTISSAASGNPISPSGSASIPLNGTILTLSSNTASGSITLPTTLVTATLPGGPDSTCDAYIGIEVIEFIELVEVCPEGATITATLTTCVSTMTRPICHTSTPGFPCYPCMGLTPSAGDTATVTRSSCTTLNPATTTVTAQTCHTCDPVTYTTTSIPGYTPGGGCKDCQPYTSGVPLTLPPPATTTTIDTATATATVRISQPAGCHDCPDAAPTDTYGVGGSGGGEGGAVPTVVPGNPGLPNTSVGGGSGAGGGYGGGGGGAPAPAPTTTATPPAMVPKPSTVPSYVTVAGGPRGVVWELGAGVVAAGAWALMMI